MQGIVFDRLRSGAVQEEWDGQFAIAALATPGVEVTYVTNWMSNGSGEEVWKPFLTNGRLPNWTPKLASAGEPMEAAIAVRFTLAPNEKKVIPIFFFQAEDGIRDGRFRRGREGSQRVS